MPITLLRVGWRGYCRRCRDAVHGRDEAVSAAGQGFDEARARGGIAQRLANLVHCGIQTVIEIDEGISGPDPYAQIFSRHDLTVILQQGAEDLKRLLLKPDASAVFSPLSDG